MGLYQLPQTRQGSVQGATEQRTDPVPPVSQPDFARYAVFSRFEESHASRFLVGAPPQIHQGATQLATHPVPPITQPEWRRYDQEDRQTLRYIVPAPPNLHQGATQIPTHPVPTVSKPQFRYYNPYDIGRYNPTLTGPSEQTTGATSHQHYIFPPNQPSSHQFPRVNVNCLLSGAGPQDQYQGATQLPTFPIPPVSQPHISQYLVFIKTDEANTHRFIVSAPPHLHQGATVEETSPIFTVNQPALSGFDSIAHAWRYATEVKKQLDVEVPPEQQAIFLLAQPEQSRFSALAQAIRFIVAVPWDASTGPTAHEQYIFPPQQPEMSRFALIVHRLRHIVDVVAQMHDGATFNQQYIFPPNQPELSRFALVRDTWRYIIGAKEQRDQGATIHDSYIFPTNQPDIRYVPGRAVAYPVLPTEAQDRQSYLFSTAQPQNYAPRRTQPTLPLIDIVGTTIRIVRRGITILSTLGSRIGVIQSKGKDAATLKTKNGDPTIL